MFKSQWGYIHFPLLSINLFGIHCSWCHWNDANDTLSASHSCRAQFIHLNQRCQKGNYTIYPWSKVNIQFWHHPLEHGKMFHPLADATVVINSRIDAFIIFSVIDFYSTTKMFSVCANMRLVLLLFPSPPL